MPYTVRILLLVIGIFLTYSAEANRCSDLHNKFNLENLLKIQAWDQQLSSLAQNVNDGLGARLFLGSAVPYNSQTLILGIKNGLLWWRMRIYLKPTLDEAIAHRLTVRKHYVESKAIPTDLTAEPIYIIAKESELNVGFTKDAAGKEPSQIDIDPAVVTPILQRGAYEINEKGEAVAISPERLQRFLKPEGFFLLNHGNRPDFAGAHGLTQEGWVGFRQHGLIDAQRWKETSGSKKLQKMTVKLLEQGYSIRFNHDYDACLKMIIEQERSFRSVNGRVSSGAGNRYSNPKTQETTLALLRSNHGYSVEVYSPQGQLVGGEIGFRHGNHLYGDTVFYSNAYNRKEHGIDGIDLAKVGTNALIEMLSAHGQHFSDPGMVTPYSASTGAELVPHHEYRQKIKSGPEQTFALPSQWDPRDGTYWSNYFSEMAKRRNQSVGAKQLILKRSSSVDEKFIAEAQASGLSLRELQIRVVKTVAEAQSHAASLVDPREIPFYIVLPGSGSELAQGKIVDVLKQSGAELISFNHPKFTKDIVRIESSQVAEALDLEGSGVAHFSQEQSAVSIKVWALTK